MIKFHSEKMKTQSTFKHTFCKGKSLYVRLSFQFLEYLSSDYTLGKEGRFSKMKAFKFLLLQSYPAPDASGDSQSKVNISRLTKKWKWSRPTVAKFFEELSNMGVVHVQKVGTEKFVSVEPSILQWIDCPQEEVHRLRDDSLQPQTPSSQSSSSERREDLSSGEKSLTM